MNVSHTVFAAVDGAVLDLRSLEALSAAPTRALDAMLVGLDKKGAILEGLELSGELSSVGPPATRRPAPDVGHATVSPGVGIARTPSGVPVLFELRDAVNVPWPTASGAAVRAVLVVAVRTVPEEGGSVRFAREDLVVEMGFVRPEEARDGAFLPVASALGNARDWLTDLSRVLPPEHPANELLVRRLDQLDQTVWKAEPEGSVWDRQVLGRNWVRYQTLATAAIQGTRAVLSTQPLHTRSRVRALVALHEQLQRSVERAGNELLQSMGAPDGSGPYAVLFDRLRARGA